jgi:acylphosphatase
MAREAFRIVVTGRVQGVGYRYWALRESASIEALAAAARGGPAAARVSDVRALPAGDDGSIGFAERPTL